jgi:multidrug efflux pump subunit AcrA (membrane-fusion protein)
MKAIRIFWIIAVIFCFSGCKKTVSEFTVMKGLFRQSFTETGELEAISSVAILMPRIRWEYGYEFKIVELAETGKLVKAGDTVIKIDPSSIEKIIITTQEKLEGERAASKKLEVQMDNNIQELKAQLRTEQAMFDLKKLELERSKFDTEKNRKIKDLDFKQATIRMDKINRQLAQKPVMDNYDFRIQKIKEKQVETELAGAKEVLGQMYVTCPIDGMFQAGNSQNYYPPRSLKVGDRAWTGMMIAKIPDITHMKVRTFVNEADITKVRIGLPVVVRLDALPEFAFKGKITELSRICTPRDKEMIFKVVVEIQESDLRLKPGMTVSCEYVCNETDNALYVPNSCLLKEAGKFYVFVGKGGSSAKTEVKVGPTNSHHTLIYSGIEPGKPLVPFETVLNKTKS